jgi:hypothetical protein
MALRGQALAKPDTTGVEDAKNYDAWGMMGVTVCYEGSGAPRRILREVSKGSHAC